MKLLVLSETADHVSCRYRVQAFAPALRQNGWEVAEMPLDATGPGFVDILREVRRSDAVLVQRRLLSIAELHVLRRWARRLIYDIDDAVFLRDSNSPKPAASWRRRFRFRAMVTASDVIIAGNNHLAECAARWSSSGRVVVIPTCVNAGIYPKIPQRRGDDTLRLAWIGSRSTLTSLYEIADALRNAGDRLPNLELHVICDSAPDLSGVKAVLHPWSASSEAGDLAGCDFGVSWLPDHPWSLGKCGLKVLQYMAAGLPVVVNAVGVHRQIVTDGVHGLVVKQADDVCGALLHLAGAPDLRRRMGIAARARVETEYSVSRWTQTFLDIIDAELLGGQAAA